MMFAGQFVCFNFRRIRATYIFLTTDLKREVVNLAVCVSFWGIEQASYDISL